MRREECKTWKKFLSGVLSPPAGVFSATAPKNQPWNNPLPGSKHVRATVWTRM